MFSFCQKLYKTAKILAKGRSCEIVNKLGPLESSWNFLRDNFPDAVYCEIEEFFENQAAGLASCRRREIAELYRRVNFEDKSRGKYDLCIPFSHNRSGNGDSGVETGRRPNLR